MVQTVQKSIEIPQLLYCDEVIDVPVVSVVQVPRVCVVKKTAVDPQFEIVETTVENPEAQTIQCSDVLVPQVQVVTETAEIPQLQVVEKIGQKSGGFSRVYPERERLCSRTIFCVSSRRRL